MNKTKKSLHAKIITYLKELCYVIGFGLTEYLCNKIYAILNRLILDKASRKLQGGRGSQMRINYLPH